MDTGFYPGTIAIGIILGPIVGGTKSIGAIISHTTGMDQMLSRKENTVVATPRLLRQGRTLIIEVHAGITA